MQSVKRMVLVFGVILACFFFPTQRAVMSYVPSMHSLTPVAKQAISALLASAIITFVIPAAFPHV